MALSAAPPRTIALDGPAAAGKSTVGRLVAKQLGGLYFDTGALYRALTYAALQAGVATDDGEALASLARARRIDVEARPASETGYAVLVAGEDVTAPLRAPEVDGAVSAVSGHAEVRHVLLDAQRRIAGQGTVVMVGRDIGTVVLPDADLKVFLVASPEARARRRFRERLARGEPAVYAEVLAAILARDAYDSGRAVAPLRAAENAVVVDTDRCGLEEVVGHVLGLVARWPDALTTGGGKAPCPAPGAHADRSRP